MRNVILALVIASILVVPAFALTIVDDRANRRGYQLQEYMNGYVGQSLDELNTAHLEFCRGVVSDKIDDYEAVYASPRHIRPSRSFTWRGRTFTYPAQGDCYTKVLITPTYSSFFRTYSISPIVDDDNIVTSVTTKYSYYWPTKYGIFFEVSA